MASRYAERDARALLCARLRANAASLSVIAALAADDAAKEAVAAADIANAYNESEEAYGETTEEEEEARLRAAGYIPPATRSVIAAAAAADAADAEIETDEEEEEETETGTETESSDEFEGRYNRPLEMDIDMGDGGVGRAGRVARACSPPRKQPRDPKADGGVGRSGRIAQAQAQVESPGRYSPAYSPTAPYAPSSPAYSPTSPAYNYTSSPCSPAHLPALTL